MAIDTTGPRTRRAVLTGTLGAVTALVAEALGRPLAARAADGDVVHVGGEHSGTRVTTITTSQGDGLSGVSTGRGGVGVSGSATATDGAGAGVHGRSASLGGSGVFGTAAAMSGETRGVFGQTLSTEGIGVLGMARAESGTTRGVSGESGSTEGIGAAGFATADSGWTFGLLGQSVSDKGTGVFGFAPAQSGETRGVLGRSDSTEGIGVIGNATTGVLGYSGPTPLPNAQPATGVYGAAGQDDGRGGVFSGRAAQLRLLPGSTARPASGETGDLFLDDSGDLWFCKGGTTWKQLA